jgi:hypothetical protein
MSTAMVPAPGGRPTFDVTGDPAIIASIATNSPLPDADTQFGKLAVTISGNQDLKLPSGPNDTVTFSGSASAFSAVGAYVSPAELTSDLGFQDADAQQLGVDFGTDGASRYMALRWGYSLAGGVSGKIALSPYGSASFGVDGSSEALYAIVRKLDNSVGARDAFLALENAWIMPRSINSLLPLGTWIISEVEGKLDANVGVNLGYDFNWVKKAQLGGLSGDVGLKILLGVNASLGVTLAGKFIMVLSCEDDPSLTRLRLFRVSKKGWNFALHAGAEFDPTTGDFLPEKLDDFIRAIFGVHDAQLVSFLTAASAQDIINKLGDDFLKAIGVDAASGFTALSNLLHKWNSLPHELASVIWKYVPDSKAIVDIASIAKKVSTADQQTINDLLSELLKDVNLDKNPAVQMLEAAAQKPLFDVLSSLAAKAQLAQRAKLVSDILDGSFLQDTLTKLQKKVNDVIDLDALQAASASGSLVGIAEWVQDRLASFLGVDKGALASKIDQLNKIIDLVRSKAGELYDATRKALNRQYAFSLDYAYSSSNMKNALIDVEFKSTAMQALQDAVGGDFRQILSTRIPGVTVRSATLTHSLNRHGHVEVHLPFYTGSSDHVLQAFASQKVADGADGRVQLFEAGAKDEAIDRGNTNTRRYAACSFGVSGVAQGVRQYNLQSVDFGYTLRVSRRGMTRSEFTYQYQPIVNTYLPNAFGDRSPDPKRAVFSSWVADWDKFTDQHPEATPDGDGVIGNTWSLLQLSMPASKDQDWLVALLNGPDEPDYRAMSRSLQAAYRAALLASYSANPANFQNISGPAIDAFFAYVSFPVLNDLRRDDDGGFIPLPKSKQIIWDVADPETVKAVLLSSQTVSSMMLTFTNIQQLLAGVPELKHLADRYSPAGARILASNIAGDPNHTQSLSQLVHFLENEALILEGAKDAFSGLRKAGSQSLADSLDAFSTASLKLVDTFNSQMKSVFDTSHIIQAMGPLIFQAAISGLYPGKVPRAVNALLNIAVLNTQTLPEPTDDPPSKEILLQQRLVALQN